MSLSGSKKRLTEALEVGKLIENSEFNLSSPKPVTLSSIKEFNIGDEHGVFCLQYNSSGSLLAVGLGSGGLQVFSLPALERVRRLHSGSVVGVPVTSVKFYPCSTKNMLFAAGSDGSISIWDMDTYRCIDSIHEQGNEISAMDFCNDGSCYATTGKDKKIRIYDTETSQLKHTLLGSDLVDFDSDYAENIHCGHGSKVFALKFHPEDKHDFVTAGWDHSLKVWDLRVQSVVRSIHGPFVCGDGIDIHGNEILTASWKAAEALQLWDFGTGRLINSLPFPTSDLKGEFLYCARFLDSNIVAAAGSGSKDVKLVDTKASKVLMAIKCDDHAVQAMDSHLTTNQLIMGTTNNMMKSAVISS